MTGGAFGMSPPIGIRWILGVAFSPVAPRLFDFLFAQDPAEPQVYVIHDIPRLGRGGQAASGIRWCVGQTTTSAATLGVFLGVVPAGQTVTPSGRQTKPTDIAVAGFLGMSVTSNRVLGG